MSNKIKWLILRLRCFFYGLKIDCKNAFYAGIYFTNPNYKKGGKHDDYLDQ